jgi:hypothetical protein
LLAIRLSWALDRQGDIAVGGSAEESDGHAHLGETVFRTLIRHYLLYEQAGDVGVNISNVDDIAKGFVIFFSHLDDYDFLTDRTGELLEEAFAAAKAERFDVAILLHATFIEHTINGFIDVLVRRKRLAAHVAIDLVRNMHIQQKLTSVLELLDVPAFGKVETDTINDILSRRNEVCSLQMETDRLVPRG